MPKTVVVVPCYNEYARINVAAFISFLRSTPDVNLIFVDDGSSDDTFKQLERMNSCHPCRIKTIQLPENSGKAEAVRQGILAAFSSEPRYVGYWDADLATPLEPIREFISVLERRPEIDHVFGTRLNICGHQIERKRSRKLLGKLFAAITSIMLGRKINDTQCGAKIFRSNTTTRQAFTDPFISKWVFDVELISRMIKITGSSHRFFESMFEFPLEQWKDVAGSKLRIHHFLIAAKDLVSIYLKYFGPFSYVPTKIEVFMIDPNSSAEKRAA